MLSVVVDALARLCLPAEASIALLLRAGQAGWTLPLLFWRQGCAFLQADHRWPPALSCDLGLKKNPIHPSLCPHFGWLMWSESELSLILPAAVGH